jgi:hypothetical protein
VLPRHTVVEITPTSVAVVHLDSGAVESRAADTVVLCGFPSPNRELSNLLREAGVAHHVVGDANGSHTLRRAVREAAYLARSL